MKNLLILVPYYLPGFKSGGPVKTVANMVEAVGDEFNITVATSDHDLGESTKYQGINTDEFMIHGKARVLYFPSTILGMFKMGGFILKSKYDFVHINSFFSLKFSIFPILLYKLFGKSERIILGPRGEFSAGALSLKPIRKYIYIKLANFFRVYKNILWHASTTYESDDIKRNFNSPIIRTAVDIVYPQIPQKFSAENIIPPLKIVFISRISPKKNLSYAIRTLCFVTKPVIFDVFGPIEDNGYWGNCKNLAGKLPSNISFNYRGTLRPCDVVTKLSDYHIFYFPTLGENFGHVVAEALLAGLPILISDQTPWRNLEEKNIGWDLPLTEMNMFVEVINRCAELKTDQYLAMRSQIIDWCSKNLTNNESIHSTFKLFEN